MSDEARTFDRRAAKEKKSQGMLFAAESRQDILKLAREGAQKAALSREDRTATSEDAQAYLISLGYSPEQLGNAAGSIFKDGEWAFTGGWKNSTRVSTHSRAVRVWRLK